jgi:hypothetical protein
MGLGMHEGLWYVGSFLFVMAGVPIPELHNMMHGNRSPVGREDENVEDLKNIQFQAGGEGSKAFLVRQSIPFKLSKSSCVDLVRFIKGKLKSILLQFSSSCISQSKNSPESSYSNTLVFHVPCCHHQSGLFDHCLGTGSHNGVFFLSFVGSWLVVKLLRNMSILTFVSHRFLKVKGDT